jgi:hypothetical protein
MNPDVSVDQWIWWVTASAPAPEFIDQLFSLEHLFCLDLDVPVDS